MGWFPNHHPKGLKERLGKNERLGIMQSKVTTKIIIDKLKLDILLRLNISSEIIVKKIKGEDVQINDPIIDDLLESLVDIKTFDNWGGARDGAGRKPKETAKNNQVEIQDENQVGNQDAQSRLNQDADKDNINNNNNILNNNINNNNTARAKTNNALEVFGNSFKATDAIVGVFDKPDGTTHEGIRIKNPNLMAFVKQRFDKAALTKASEWAIDHNQRGHTYNATSLLKLLCKFQSNIEPSINFNHVQAEYLTFGQITRQEA